MPNITNFHPRRNDVEWRAGVRSNLQKFNGKFLFQKADGSLREMTCTLQESIVPEVKAPRVPSNTSMVVYDIEKEGWRTIIYEKIVDFKVLVN